MQQKVYTEKQKELFGVYEALNQRIRASGAEILPERVSFYINTCRAGVLDLQDTLGAKNDEFLVMVYYSIFGDLPEERILCDWQDKLSLPEWEFRSMVMKHMLDLPEVQVHKISVYNNIYQEESEKKGRKRSLKQRILVLGYQVSRRLPLGIKAPLKKIALRFLMK